MTETIDGRYEVLAKIKDGGMGTVFKVRHVHLDEVRVVKVMRADILDDDDARARFVREARLAKGLHHENIALLHDFAEDRDGAFYMVLEFVDGPSLAEVLGALGALPVGVAVDVAIQTLSALGHLHRKGIVHRDVSPENVLLTLSEDGRPLVKLIDLGIAKETTGDGLTLSGMFLGKLKYASPEQLGALARGEVIDGRSDLYSLACVLYQLLTGEAAFRAETPQAYAMLHLMRRPRPFEETDPAGRVPSELRAVLLKGVEKRREDRWRSAEEFSAALAAFRDGLAAEAGEDRAVAEFVERYRAESSRNGTTEAVSTATPPRRRTTPPSSRRDSALRVVAVALGTVLLLGVGVGAAILVRSRVREIGVRTVPERTGTLLLTSSPWARVTSVVEATRRAVVDVAPCSTPLNLPLPEGKYRLGLSGGPPGSGETSIEVSVSAGRETVFHADLPGFDVERAVRSYAP